MRANPPFFERSIQRGGEGGRRKAPVRSMQKSCYFVRIHLIIKIRVFVNKKHDIHEILNKNTSLVRSDAHIFDSLSIILLLIEKTIKIVKQIQKH